MMTGNTLRADVGGSFWNRGPVSADWAPDVNWGEMATEVAGLGYWRLDLASEQLTWSDGLFRLYGLQADGAPNLEAVISTMHRDDRERMKGHVRRAMDSPRPCTDQARLRRPDGSWRVFSHHTVCKRLSGGRVETAFGVVMDVTERETYRVLAENGNDLVVKADLEGRITYMSPSVTPMTGFTPEELVGQYVSDIVGPEAAGDIEAAILELLAHPDRRPRSVEYMVLDKAGRRIWLEARPTPLLDPTTGRRIGLTDVVRDITERKTAETKLEFANILLATQMEASPNGIVVLNADQTILSFNRRFAGMWNIPSGLPHDALVSRDGNRLMREGVAFVRDPDVFLARAKFFEENPDQGGYDDVELLDGRIIERYTVPLLAPSGDPLGRAWFFSDVSAQRQSLADALTAARRDILTGLANRAVFMEVLAHEIARANRGESRFAVIFLDLDRFKEVNDTLGHAAGDELLKAVAKRLQSNTRDADTVARFGGDEFAIIVANLGEPTDAAILADKLIQALGEPFSIQGAPVYTSASIGIDLHEPGTTDAEGLLSHADMALYRAKALGRSCYHFFTAVMDKEVHGRVTLAAELHDAIAGDQLFLLYQPQVCLATGRITGLEALIRWRHPRLGILKPEAFMPTAEHMGVMASLGRWRLSAALRQARTWLDAGLPLARLGVDISVARFKAPLTFEADVAAALLETALPSGLLELELTEAALMAAAREDGAVLPRLRQAGVTIAIDEFGVDCSYLQNLRDYPIDRIKISPTYVQNLDAAFDAVVVKASIDLAHALGARVLAAGVETEAQLNLLEGWNCAEGQGPLFGEPMQASRVPTILVNGLAPAPWNRGRDQRAPPRGIAARSAAR